MYAAKSVYTRARSVWWQARPGGRAKRPGLRILAYHRVAPGRDELAVSPKRFQEQMQYLAVAGYCVVGAGEAAASLNAPNRDQVVGLTFDDAYLDVSEHAVPVLERLGFRATIFVPTGAVSGTHPFSWYDQPPPLLDWPMIRDLDRRSTVDFGAHTISHANLLAVDDARAASEIAGSKRMLEERIGHQVEAFCYPAGLFGDRERRLVRESGFQVAVGMEPGANGPDSDRLSLRRIGIGPRDRLLDFRAKLTGGHDDPPPLRSTYRRLRFARAPGAKRHSDN